jgi:glycerol uptake facilitator-like aquaporin
MNTNMKQYGAEFFGTFWLVLGGCGVGWSVGEWSISRQ